MALGVFSSRRTNDQDLGPEEQTCFQGARLFIHLIGCEHDQDLGPPFSHVFKQVGHWSTYIEKNAFCQGTYAWHRVTTCVLFYYAIRARLYKTYCDAAFCFYFAFLFSCKRAPPFMHAKMVGYTGLILFPLIN